MKEIRKTEFAIAILFSVLMLLWGISEYTSKIPLGALDPIAWFILPPFVFVTIYWIIPMIIESMSKKTSETSPVMCSWYDSLTTAEQSNERAFFTNNYVEIIENEQVPLVNIKTWMFPAYINSAKGYLFIPDIKACPMFWITHVELLMQGYKTPFEFARKVLREQKGIDEVLERYEDYTQEQLEKAAAVQRSGFK